MQEKKIPNSNSLASAQQIVYPYDESVYRLYLNIQLYKIIDLFFL